MYGSERFTLSLPRPFPLYLPRPPAIAAAKPAPPRNEMDDYAYRSELPQSSSTENSSDNKTDHAPTSEMKEFSSCLASLVPPISSHSVAAFLAQAIPSAELKLYDNESCGMKMEGEGGVDDERKREREHKKRSKNWTRPETLKLIRVRTDLDEKFGRIGRKAELWDEIAEALQRDNYLRDAQQCKDKWEKLSAGYKEVRDGIRDKEDNPYFDDLQLLFSGRSKRREREGENEDVHEKEKQDMKLVEELELDLGGDYRVRGVEENGPSFAASVDWDAARNKQTDQDAARNKQTDQVQEQALAKRRKRGPKHVSVTDLSAVQELLESVLARQQTFFSDLLDSMDKKQQLKEQIRQEREERWRAEERAESSAFNNAMINLTQKLLGEMSGAGTTSAATSSENLPEEHLGPKKRSKNWKRTEVLQLIKLRGEMDSKFSMPTRRAALWEELAEILGAQGIQREGKQCREKWDKLMAEYKDVSDGRRDQCESPFFAELKAFMDEGHLNG